MGTNSPETSGTPLKTAGGILKVISLVLLTYVVGVSIYAIFQYGTTKSKLLTYGLTDATASLIATAAMLIALGLPSFAVFRIVIHRGRALDYAAALVLPLLAWGIAQLPANFDARTGAALKYCATRPDDSLFCLDRPGIDPLTQKQLAPMSQSLAEVQFRKDRGLVPKRITDSPSDIVFFDPLTAQPKVWVLHNDQGCYDMFDNPGAHPQTGEQLQPATKDIVRLINQCTKRDASNLSAISLYGSLYGEKTDEWITGNCGVLNDKCSALIRSTWGDGSIGDAVITVHPHSEGFFSKGTTISFFNADHGCVSRGSYPDGQWREINITVRRGSTTSMFVVDRRDSQTDFAHHADVGPAMSRQLIALLKAGEDAQVRVYGDKGWRCTWEFTLKNFTPALNKAIQQNGKGKE